MQTDVYNDIHVSIYHKKIILSCSAANIKKNHMSHSQSPPCQVLMATLPYILPFLKVAFIQQITVIEAKPAVRHEILESFMNVLVVFNTRV